MRVRTSTILVGMLAMGTALALGCGRRARAAFDRADSGRWDRWRKRLNERVDRLQDRLHRKFGWRPSDEPIAPDGAAEETRAVERLIVQLDRMERRVDNLETILERQPGEGRARGDDADRRDA